MVLAGNSGGIVSNDERYADMTLKEKKTLFGIEYLQLRSICGKLRRKEIEKLYCSG
jgi:hypothetical protein